MRREIGVQDTKKLHQPSGDVLGQAVWALQWQGIADASCYLRTQGTGKRTSGRRLAHTKKASSHWVEMRIVIFVELALLVD